MPRSKNTILIVDDEFALANALELILVMEGYRVFTAFHGKEAVASALKVKPDLIILDLMMPNVDGYGVLDRLKEDDRLKHIPVIVVTAKDLTNDERNRLTGQVQGLLSKGSFIDDDMLLNLLDEKLRR